MPGSRIQAVLPSAYQTAWSFAQTGGGGAGSWADSTNSTFTVPSHPFTTGDVMYVRLFSASDVVFTTQVKYYAIVVSPTQLRYASTSQNAINGTALTIPSALSTSLSSAIGNHPLIGYGSVFYAAFYTNIWNASSKSLVTFSSQSKVRIDIEFLTGADATAIIANAFLGTANFSYVCGFFQDISRQSAVGETNTGSTGYTFGNFAQVTQQLLPPVVRFTIENGRISTAVKLNDGSFTTRFTSGLLPSNLNPLHLFVNMGLNGLGYKNCTITYF
jgi:hypothetical protein